MSSKPPLIAGLLRSRRPPGVDAETGKATAILAVEHAATLGIDPGRTSPTISPPKSPWPANQSGDEKGCGGTPP